MSFKHTQAANVSLEESEKRFDRAQRVVITKVTGHLGCGFPGWGRHRGYAEPGEEGRRSETAEQTEKQTYLPFAAAAAPPSMTLISVPLPEPVTCVAAARLAAISR
jgi:hypothetical protein